jgi:site-specific recombinase XerD
VRENGVRDGFSAIFRYLPCQGRDHGFKSRPGRQNLQKSPAHTRKIYKNLGTSAWKLSEKSVYAFCPPGNSKRKKARSRDHKSRGRRHTGLSLSRARDNYILDLETARQAQSTIAAKRIVLTQLVNYGEEHDWPPVDELTVDHLRRYLAEVQKRPRWFGKRSRGEPISASYYQTIYRRINTFFNWLVEEGDIPPEDNPMLRIRRPKLEERVIPVVDKSDFEVLMKLRDPALYKTPSARFRAFRDRAALWVLADTSARREGITGLRVNDVDLSEKRLTLMEKGRKERFAWIGGTTAKALGRYMGEREMLQPVTDALWVDADGTEMKPVWIYNMLKRWGSRAGIPDLHPHRFRHTFAVTMLEEGTPDAILEIQGGWKKIPKTYKATIGDKQAQDWHRRVSPADRLARGMGKRGR